MQIDKLSFETVKEGDNINFPKKGCLVKCHFIGKVFQIFDKTKTEFSFKMEKFLNQPEKKMNLLNFKLVLEKL